MSACDAAEVDSALRFLYLLRSLPPRPDVFNPWRDYDPVNDGRLDAAAVRAVQLSAYLAVRCGRAKLVLVAEAPGYQGAKHSGIAMTSERILLGRLPEVPASVAFGVPGLQTSQPDIHPNGRAEPTATIAWKQMLALGYKPEEFVFWNAFPCHPHKPGQPLTNRAPTAADMDSAAHVLPQLLALFSSARVVAVGNVARDALGGMGIEAPSIRHPANGGATKFRDQLAALA